MTHHSDPRSLPDAEAPYGELVADPAKARTARKPTNASRTPKSLLADDLNKLYARSSYHSGTICLGVANLELGM